MTARKPPAHLRAAETRARNSPPLPRAVRELLRDVVLADYLDNAPNDPKDAPLVAVWLALLYFSS